MQKLRAAANSDYMPNILKAASKEWATISSDEKQALSNSARKLRENNSPYLISSNNNNNDNIINALRKQPKLYNSFSLFMRENIDRFKGTTSAGNYHISKISKAASNEWATLSPEEKESWRYRALAEREIRKKFLQEQSGLVSQKSKQKIPINAFGIFLKYQRVSSNELFTLTDSAVRWRQLSLEERQIYFDIARSLAKSKQAPVYAEGRKRKYVSSFALFFKDFTAVRRESPSTGRLIIKEAAAKWRELSLDQRQIYHEKRKNQTIHHNEPYQQQQIKIRHRHGCNRLNRYHIFVRENFSKMNQVEPNANECMKMIASKWQQVKAE